MPFTFPDFNIVENKRTHKWGEEIIDAAIQENLTRTDRLRRMNINYQFYNGAVNSKAMQWLTKTYGKTSVTKYRDYKLMRTKIKQLIGEFLTTPITSTVRAINKNAINEKLNNAYFILGAVHAKDQIEKLKQENGVDPTAGMQLPDKDDPNLWKYIAPQSKNEVVMQRIINDKIKKRKIKNEFLTNTIDTIVAAECFGKIERNKNGVDVFRAIDPRYALYQESYGDWLLQRTPYIGEYKEMYIYEILRDMDIPEDKIDVLKNSEYNSTEFTNMGLKLVNNQHAADVYTIQFKSFTRIITKIIPANPMQVLDDGTTEETPPYYKEISPEQYESQKESITNDIKKGKYQIEIKWKEDLYEQSRIGKTIYTKLKKVNDQIQRKEDGKYYTVTPDYCGMLYFTVDGIRISMQELGNDLQTIHNIIMFQINREVNKMKGSVIGYDRAYIPGGKNGNMRDLWFNVTEHGYLEYDSSEDGNKNDDKKSGLGAVQQLNVGESTVIQTLLALKADVEATADKITGITRDRGGAILASETVTNAQSNITASKSMTQDIFYLLNEFFENVLMRLCEKTKLNKEWLETEGLTVLGSDAVQYIKATAEIADDEYIVELSDGRKENEIRDRLRQFFPVEINSGQLRAKDVARFELEENITEAIAVLDKAYVEITNVAQMQNNNKLQQENDQLKQQLQQVVNDKQGDQQHARDMKVLDIEGQKEIVGLKGQLQFGQKVYDKQNSIIDSDFQREHEKEMQQEQLAAQQQQQSNKVQTN
ncbi:MAG: hypothetical protein WC479_07105 [Candidatus Izemoplasmatales bacterium]|jgi:hypothetical protein